MNSETPAIDPIPDNPLDGWIAKAGACTRALVAVVQSLWALTACVLALIILTSR